MKAVSRTGVSVITALMLIGGASAPAFAEEAPGSEPPTDDTAIVSEFLESLDLPDSDVLKAVNAFDSLSSSEQDDIISTLQSDSPTDIFGLGEAKVTTTRTRALTAARTSVAAATYEVTANYSYPVAALGITFGSFNLRYRYQTGSNRVLKDYACTAWRSGTAGFWSYSVTTDHWVSGGIGNCVALFTGSLVYKGSSITQNKEIGMTVNGAGVRSTWLTAV